MHPTGGLGKLSVFDAYQYILQNSGLRFTKDKICAISQLIVKMWSDGRDAQKREEHT